MVKIQSFNKFYREGENRCQILENTESYFSFQQQKENAKQK